MRGPEGPFPAPRARERPWDATETERGPFERRRSGDRRQVGEVEGNLAGGGAGADAGTGAEAGAGEGARSAGRRRHWGRRKSDVLTIDAQQALSVRGQALVRRFREPLIGLTLAGVAAPLINAGVSLPAPAPAEDEDVGDAQAATLTRDLETAVGDYWAEAEEGIVRGQTIEGAATRWGISTELADKIYDAASRHEIEPDVAYGLVFVESTFQERAVSHVGARGLAQVMPRTARWLDPSVGAADLFDPEVNLELGFRYLRQLIDKYDGNLHKALTAYNRGPGTVDRILRRGGNPDNGYAGKVMAG
jgi:hypothetical protein